MDKIYAIHLAKDDHIIVYEWTSKQVDQQIELLTERNQQTTPDDYEADPIWMTSLQQVLFDAMTDAGIQPIYPLAEFPCDYSNNPDPVIRILQGILAYQGTNLIEDLVKAASDPTTIYLTGLPFRLHGNVFLPKLPEEVECSIRVEA